MNRILHRSLEYLQFETLPNDRFDHAVFTRKGGVSPAPWQALNLGGTVGDQQTRVAQNRELAVNALGLPTSALHEVWQVHSRAILRVQAPRQTEQPVRADGMVTDRSGVVLLMRFADCVPLLVVDPVRGAVGIAHAGWKGTVQRAAMALVEKMAGEYGSDPQQLHAAIGPSIGPDHYPVGPEVEEQVQQSFGKQAVQHLLDMNGRVHFDLWSANQALLEAAGIPPAQIENPRICTACNLSDWYSHRGEAGATGRFGALVCIRE